MIRKTLITFCVVSLLLMAGSSKAGVDIDVNIGLPLFTFAEPPELVVIPNTYVYFAPSVDFDIVFYHGYWYRPYGGRWYRARGYNGPWGYVVGERVPRYVYGLPSDYRLTYRDYPRIPHYHVHDNWNRWEREKYWHKRQWKHEQQEWRRDRREDRRERRQDIREHQQDRREDRRERRQDIREHQRDRSEDRRELRKDSRQERSETRQEQRQDMRGQRQDGSADRREQSKDMRQERKDNRQDRRDEKQRPAGEGREKRREER